MTKIRATALFSLLAALLAIALWHPATAPIVLPQRDTPPVPVVDVPAPVAAAAPIPPPPPVKPGAERYFDGRRWHDVYWAPDEMHMTLKAGVTKPALEADVVIVDERPRELTLRRAPMTRAEWPEQARKLQALPGVRDVQPVYYPTAQSFAKREAPRQFLTSKVVVTLPPDADAAKIAARNGAELLQKLSFMPDTYVFKAAGAFEALDLATALKEKEGAVKANAEFAMLPSLHGIPPNDPLYPQQWHLKNTGQASGVAGEDVRAEAAWALSLGAGSVVGVIDTGVEFGQPDLAANYLGTASFDFNDNDSDPSPGDATENHATAVAGVAAAVGDNGLGVTGIAPQAKFAGLRLLGGSVSASDIASAFSFSNDVITVKNNSWGFKAQNDPTLDTFPHGTDLSAISSGFINGRGGKGTLYVFSAGNGAGSLDDANYNAYCTMREVIAVGATTDAGTHAVYSDPGANLLICTPSGGGGAPFQNIQTTDRSAAAGYDPSDYTGTGANGFSGTSSAAPLASGVIALMISANPNLRARDVQHVLVRTARKQNSDASWFTNAAGVNCSHLYGHGVVDAGAAVAMSKYFPAPPAVQQVNGLAGNLNLAIADSPGSGTFGPPTVSPPITLPSAGALRVEHVEVFLDVTHTYRGDLRVRLTHAGTTSVLANVRSDGGDDYANWLFLSTMHWGESSAGDWTLTIDDGAPVDTGTLLDWRIFVWGTPIDTTAPVAGTVKDGLAADIQFQDSTTSISANWTTFSEPQSGVYYEWAIGTTPGATDVQAFTNVAFAMNATANGLSLSTGSTYYVSVRATNFEGLQTVATSNGVLVTADTQITGKPTDPSGVISPTFTFSANIGGCTFLYSVDGAAFIDNGTNTSVTIGPLGAGTHTFTVYAVDGGGHADPTPATYTWTIPVPIVDGTAPFLNPFDGGIFLTNWTAASTGTPAWAVDSLPLSILSSSLSYFTAPSSLNYNNDVDYATGGVANSGTMTSPTINVAGVAASAKIKFMCNYDTDTTGTATDQRTILIMNPALSSTLATVQLSGGASAAGPCAAPGTWHEHVLPIQGAWGTSFRIRFSFDTVNATANSGAGWFIDDLELSELTVSALAQYLGSSTTVLPVGSSTSTSIRLEGIVSTAAAGLTQLQVEVQPASVPFTGTPNYNSLFATTGNLVSVMVGPSAGEYHWRARSMSSTGTTSGWMDFGLNASTAPDFIIPGSGNAGGGGGGGGGCGATGLEWTAVAGLLLLLRRRKRA